MSCYEKDDWLGILEYSAPKISPEIKESYE